MVPPFNQRFLQSSLLNKQIKYWESLLDFYFEFKVVTKGIVELFVEATTMPRSTVIKICNFHVRSLKRVLIKKKHPKFHEL
jgi:hypothetical protein